MKRPQTLCHKRKKGKTNKKTGAAAKNNNNKNRQAERTKQQTNYIKS